MATAEQRQETLKKVTTQLSELTTIDPKMLARTTDLSPDINFKDAVPYFAEMLDLCKQLGQRDISRLTTQQLSPISGACTRLAELIEQVQKFNLNQNTPGDVCKTIIKNISDAYDDVMNPMLVPLAFTATQATDYAKIEREAKGYHATMKAEAEELYKFLGSVRSEAERALSAVKEQAAEAGVSTNAQIFTVEAQEHHNVAKKWLTATIIMAALTFLVAVSALFVAFTYEPKNTAAVIQYVVAKLLVLSTLSYGVFWSARNYKSQMHNETLNRHRANALMTFRAFVEGTSDDRVKDAILLQASQAAFSTRSTGFDDPENDSQTINPVVEILGKALPQASSKG